MTEEFDSPIKIEMQVALARLNVTLQERIFSLTREFSDKSKTAVEKRENEVSAATTLSNAIECVADIDIERAKRKAGYLNKVCDAVELLSVVPDYKEGSYNSFSMKPIIFRPPILSRAISMSGARHWPILSKFVKTPSEVIHGVVKTETGREFYKNITQNPSIRAGLEEIASEIGVVCQNFNTTSIGLGFDNSAGTRSR